MAGRLVMVPTVDVADLPDEVDNWCLNNGIETHTRHIIVQICDDGNPFAEWLKSKFGFSFFGMRSI